MYEQIKKVIARDGSREIVDSDEIEFMNVTQNGLVPDFKDESIICIKFLISDNGSLEDYEDTNWFINKPYAEKFIQPLEGLMEDYDEESYPPFSMSNGVYTVFSDFIPEIFLLDPPKHFALFQIFQDFYNKYMCILPSLSIEQAFNLYVDYANKYPDV